MFLLYFFKKSSYFKVFPKFGFVFCFLKILVYTESWCSAVANIKVWSLGCVLGGVNCGEQCDRVSSMGRIEGRKYKSI